MSNGVHLVATKGWCSRPACRLSKLIPFALSLLMLFAGRTVWGQETGPQVFHRSWDRSPLELTLDLSDTSPFVSDEVFVHLRVRSPAGSEVELPRLDAFPKDLQISDLRRDGPESEPDGRSLWELTFKLQRLVAGSSQLPALVVRYRTAEQGDWLSAETEPVFIEFRSMLGDEPDSAEPRPNPGPSDWPIGWLFWVLLASVCIIMIVLAWGGWMLRSARPTKAVPVRRRISAHDKAMRAIDEIEEAGHLDRGDVERFYTELSGVVRHYIEDRFGLRAPEQTTEEFLQELMRRPVLVDAQRLALSTFLERCDLVKFAKVRPNVDEGKSALNAARSFVEATRDDSILVEV